jgi:hypothetical protein
MPHDNQPVMVCLISRQTMQNLLPILQYRPQQVFCLTTREGDGSRKHLADILHTQQIALDAPLYVDAYVPESTTQACREIIARHGADRLIANLTGGTKIMLLAAFRAFAAAHVPCLYTDTPHRVDRMSLVFETVKQGGFDSYATNVALAWRDAPEREMNEIDVAVVHNNTSLSWKQTFGLPITFPVQLYSTLEKP